MQRCLLAEFDLVGGRLGDLDEGQSLAAMPPTALVKLTYEEMISMSTVITLTHCDQPPLLIFYAWF